MRSVVELLSAKRDGQSLQDAEIEELISDYASGQLPDYQMSALLMAIYFQGLNPAETKAWTHAMLNSGDVLDLHSLGPGRVDKHSTGGVGDKISLPLAPAAAACGCIVPMVSGRGLGHTGGTIDKLEAIPGYRADLSVAAFRAQLAAHGCAIIGQTARLAPADKRLYALRDVTATVPSIPLIVASIMSKKLAEGIEGLVLDIKVGRAAFMKTVEQARELAEAMVRIGEGMNKRVVAFLTRMEEPLGEMIGNACEVRESMRVLEGQGPPDVRELVVTLGGAMVEIAQGVDAQTGQARIAKSLDDGSAMARWRAMIAAQGGRLEALPEASERSLITSPRDGWIEAIDGLELGLSAVSLGAGRNRQEDVINPRIGIQVLARRGSQVSRGQPIAAILHDPDTGVAETIIKRIQKAFQVSAAAPPSSHLILERIG